MNLYHYCSVETFFSIISNRSIRLHDVTASNDYLEGRLVRKILLNMARYERLDSAQRKALEGYIEIVEHVNTGYAFCLSEVGDLLSQWRGYAADGYGFSLAFDADALGALLAKQSRTMKLVKVAYNEADQQETLKPAYSKIMAGVRGGALGIGKHSNPAWTDMMQTILDLHVELFSVKGYAFHEEREWRVIAPMQTTHLPNVQFRPGRDRLIPFIGVTLPENVTNLVTKVVIGPKNRTPKAQVASFLEQHGFINAEVVESTASYR